MVGDGASLPKGTEKGREQKFHEDSSFTNQNRTKTENEGISRIKAWLVYLCWMRSAIQHYRYLHQRFLWFNSRHCQYNGLPICISGQDPASIADNGCAQGNCGSQIQLGTLENRAALELGQGFLPLLVYLTSGTETHTIDNNAAYKDWLNYES